MALGTTERYFVSQGFGFWFRVLYSVAKMDFESRLANQLRRRAVDAGKCQCIPIETESVHGALIVSKFQTGFSLNFVVALSRRSHMSLDHAGCLIAQVPSLGHVPHLEIWTQCCKAQWGACVGSETSRLETGALNPYRALQ